MSETARRRGLMETQKVARLPVEYQEVEWIGSDEAEEKLAYIQLPQFASVSPGAEGTMWRGNRDIQSFLDVQYSGFLTVQPRYYNGFGVKIKNSAWSFFGSMVGYNQKISFSVINGEVTYKGKTYPCPVGTSYTSGGIKVILFGSKVYGDLKIYDVLAVKYHLVSCYRKADNAVGLYDLITKRFFGNAGTGTLTKGADV